MTTARTTIEVMIPRKVWSCSDCGTITDYSDSDYHRGHTGHVLRTKPKFAQSKIPKRLESGEVIWIDRPPEGEKPLAGKELLQVVIKKAIDEDRDIGMMGMAYGPDSGKKATKAGFKLKREQGIGALVTTYAGDEYVVCFLELETGKFIGSVWKGRKYINSLALEEIKGRPKP